MLSKKVLRNASKEMYAHIKTLKSGEKVYIHIPKWYKRLSRKDQAVIDYEVWEKIFKKTQKIKGVKNELHSITSG